MKLRQVLAAAALVALVLSSGCLGYITGPSDLPAEQLNQEPPEPYAWNATQDVHLTVTANGTFLGVYNLSAPGFDGTLELYRKDSLGTKEPLSIRAVRYRYPNGTVLVGSEIAAHGGDITKTRKVVEVTPPKDTGQLAFTAGSTPKRFTLPVFMEGSYEVVLPPDRRIDAPIVGHVVPQPTRIERIDDQTHIYWTELTTQSLVVQFYLERDIQIFVIAATILSLFGAAGLLYYRRQIQKLQAQREELGLDVDTGGDEFDDGPPPGMG